MIRTFKIRLSLDNLYHKDFDMKNSTLFWAFFLLLSYGTFSCKSSKEVTEMTMTEEIDSAETTETPQVRQNQSTSGRRGQFAEAQQEILEAINLSEEQESAFKAIQRKYLEKLRDARQEANGDREEMMGQLRALRQEQQAEIKELLTAEQYEAYQKKIAEMRGNRQRGGF